MPFFKNNTTLKVLSEIENLEAKTKKMLLKTSKMKSIRLLKKIWND